MPRGELGPLLAFKERYLDAVLSGRKTVTVRLGIVRPSRGLVYIACCGMVYGEAAVLRVEYTRLGLVGREVLRAEGVSSVEELLEELGSIYRGLTPDSTVSVIYFALLRRYDRPIPAEKVGGGPGRRVRRAGPH